MQTDLFALSNRVAIVTGSARGLGFLASDAASYGTGAVLAVDGGYTAV